MGCGTSAQSDVAEVVGRFHERYNVQHEIGSGAFGQVRLCEATLSKKSCAVKVIYLHTVDDYLGHTKLDRELLRGARHEASIWAKVSDHPNVVSLYEVHLERNFYFMVMELCQHSLLDGLVDKRSTSEADVLRAFRDMLLGIAYLHEQGVVHRDVKPANFLINKSGDVVLCDFGLATIETSRGLIGCMGTPPYMSPEMVQRRIYDRSTDIWSFGVTAYLILYGCLPYYPRNTRQSTPSDIKTAIARGVPQPSFQPAVNMQEPSLAVGALARELLERDPLQRRSAEQLLAMDVIRSAELCDPEDTHSWSAQALCDIREWSRVFEQRVDPTHARGIEELIGELQHQKRETTLRSFSLDGKSQKLPLQATHRISRAGTHSGETSIAITTIKDNFPSDDASTISTSEGDPMIGDGRSFPPTCPSILGEYPSSEYPSSVPSEVPVCLTHA